MTKTEWNQLLHVVIWYTWGFMNLTNQILTATWKSLYLLLNIVHIDIQVTTTFVLMYFPTTSASASIKDFGSNTTPTFGSRIELTKICSRNHNCLSILVQQKVEVKPLYHQGTEILEVDIDFKISDTEKQRKPSPTALIFQFVKF